MDPGPFCEMRTPVATFSENNPTTPAAMLEAPPPVAAPSFMQRLRHLPLQTRRRIGLRLLSLVFLVVAMCLLLRHRNHATSTTAVAVDPRSTRIRDGSAATMAPPATRVCAHAHYMSTPAGTLHAVSGNVTSPPLFLKGINWFGLEGTDAILAGLDANGTTLEDVADFLARHGFNSLRLPLAVTHILDNTRSNSARWNAEAASTTYLAFLGRVVQIMAARNISILLDLHVLSPHEVGDLWYSNAVPESMVVAAIHALSAAFCTSDYWNVLGVDLKNEPFGASWTTNATNRSWHEAVDTLGSAVVTACPQWLAFVQGAQPSSSNKTTDLWRGAGFPASMPTLGSLPANKIVFAPHYYTPSTEPLPLFYNVDATGQLVEMDDEATLTAAVQASMTAMFPSGGAIVIGEFGGLYGAADAHPKKTASRVLDIVIATITARYAGGFLWSLNPDSLYGFDWVNQTQRFVPYGLLAPTWLDVHGDLLGALNPMTQSSALPCFAP
ncbi:Aste57867_22879 [Aphanomyces stellatus]|uniref:Aste57867_22879 protein n=1 Tax=Aphanomyces stellatus TaxID=120398 RepID=A0A485LL45_9STRA|nr:hypothetical protein As57867_022808 [Aphanomyces stellatus]VFT99529.1 Aste57867_22879 [Aphanomyces stellatus]